MANKKSEPTESEVPSVGSARTATDSNSTSDDHFCHLIKDCKKKIDNVLILMWIYGGALVVIILVLIMFECFFNDFDNTIRTQCISKTINIQYIREIAVYIFLFVLFLYILYTLFFYQRLWSYYSAKFNLLELRCELRLSRAGNLKEDEIESRKKKIEEEEKKIKEEEESIQKSEANIEEKEKNIRRSKEELNRIKEELNRNEQIRNEVTKEIIELMADIEKGAHSFLIFKFN